MHPFLKRDSLSSVSERLQKPIFIGTSGWAYRSWKPGFYPQSLPQKKFLDYYATHLSSVEVNYTFRQLPSASTLAGWLAASGAGFRFSFKAPQRLTHILRLRNCSGEIGELGRALSPVSDVERMGVCCFSFHPISELTCLASIPSLARAVATAYEWPLNSGTLHGFAMKCTTCYGIAVLRCALQKATNWRRRIL